MPIRRRRDGWQVDVRVHGERVRRTVDTKATAIELEAKLRDDAARSRLGLSPRRTLADALAEYLTTSAPALRSFASLLYVARVVRPFLNRPIDRIADAAADIIRDGRAHDRKPATINRHLALLRRLGSLALMWGWTDTPVGKRVVLLPERNERHVYLTVEQVAALAAACATDGARDAVLLAAYTGLRRGELLALTPAAWRDGALWLATSKSGRPRRVPVPPQAQDVCARLPLKTTAVHLRMDFEQARAAVGLTGVRFHDLRHTYASLLIQAGVDLRAVKDLMGHSTMQMTSRYAHLEDKHLTRAVKKISPKRGDHLVTTSRQKPAPKSKKPAKKRAGK
jgi:integrase